MAGEDEPYYMDKQKLLEAAEKYGTLTGASVALGGSPQTLSVWWRKHGLPKLRGGRRLSTQTAKSTREEWVLETIRANPDRSIYAIADLLDISPRSVRESVQALQQSGHAIDISDGEEVKLKTLQEPTDWQHQISFEGDVYRFAVVSDTHLGSKEQQLEGLHAAYDEIEAQGLDTVYHPGDLVCGKGIYPAQVNEVFLHTYQAQVDYAAEHYPIRHGVTTHIIAGNHDLEGEFGRVGANPVMAVCNRREDMIYGGDYRATYLTPQGAKIYLIHPKGGKSYAISYKPQKLAESFLGGNKPNIALIGHYHDAAFFWSRSIAMLMSGTFEAGGTLGYRAFLGEPAVGFWTCEAHISDDGTVRKFYPRWHPVYYEGGRHGS